MRTILHSDLNNFFASVEIKENPELKDKYVAVCGSTEERHGIVLAKNEKAKRLGVKTGMVIWEAKKLCPELVIVEPHMDNYVHYSEKVREIYKEYTDKIEPFGIDEAWLDVTHSKIFGTGKEIADKIRQRIKDEIGLTASIGVSFNKVFAKLGSDMKKPDATTEITEKNYKETVWKLNVSDMIFIGKSSVKKLNDLNIFTIGDLAKADKQVLENVLGKWGGIFSDYANGLDNSPVINAEIDSVIKSVSNSMTCYRDLEDIEDVKMMFYLLADSVSRRVVKYDLGRPKTVTIWVKDSTLNDFTKQKSMRTPTILTNDICEVAIQLFKETYTWKNKVRSLGLGVSNFYNKEMQLDMFNQTDEYLKKEKLEKCVSHIKDKYGNTVINRGIIFKDKKIMSKKIADRPIFK